METLSAATVQLVILHLVTFDINSNLQNRKLYFRFLARDISSQINKWPLLFHCARPSSKRSTILWRFRPCNPLDPQFRFCTNLFETGLTLQLVNLTCCCISSFLNISVRKCTISGADILLMSDKISLTGYIYILLGTFF